MKSRALPQEFDRTSTLFSAISIPRQPDIVSTTQPPYGFAESMRDTNSAPDFGHPRAISEETSSTSVPSAYSEPLWTPASVVLGSQSRSQVPSADERTEYTGSLIPQLRTPNAGTPYAQFQGFPTIDSTSTYPRSRIELGRWL